MAASHKLRFSTLPMRVVNVDNLGSKSMCEVARPPVGFIGNHASKSYY